MKNTFLKKYGALALAAVMAVTFAPAASLTAFANSGSVGKHNGTANVVTGTATIDENGTYTVSGGAGTVAITISGSATKVTIKLSKANESDDVSIGSDATNTGAALTIDGGDAYSWDEDNGWKGSKVTLANATSFSSIAIKGDITVSDDGELELSGKIASAFGSLPVAKTGTALKAYVVGDKLIATQSAGKQDIYAVNGVVKAEKLASGHVAMLDDDANAGTKVSATAADKTSLVKVDTTYTYIFRNETVGDYGTSTFEDVRYAAGKYGLTNAKLKLNNQPNGTDINTNYLKGGKTKNTVKAIKNYERAITLTQSGDDKFDKDVHIAYADSHDYNDETDVNANGENGITYFTTDPSAFVADKDGVAKIDGGKYVINRDGTYYDTGDTKKETKLNQLEQASKSASKSIEVVRGTSETTNAADAYDVVAPAKGVTVSAPTSASVVIGHKTLVGTKYNTTVNKGYIFGANRVEGVNQSNFLVGSSELSNSIVSTAIEVPQVAKDTYAVVKNGYTDTEVTLGDGVTYFYDEKSATSGANLADFVFGSVEIVDKNLKAVLSGETIGTTNYFSQAKAGDTIYVAKAVQDTFKNVPAKVTVVGEISADKTAAADGTFTWVVNKGYGSDAVPAYRMYRKTGEHVYTINPAEVSMLEQAGWINEGVAFKVNSVASKKGTPIYRVYNKNNGGMHFYTASAAERDMLLNNGWIEGATVFYGADKATGIPVYRTYNTGSNNGEHNYTTNIAESDMNVKAGWRAEGVAFYVFK